MATPSANAAPLTGDQLLDAATHGYRWQLASDRTLDWALANGFFGEVWTTPATAANTIGAALATFSVYADIKFNYLGHYTNPSAAFGAGSDITVSLGGFLLFRSISTWALGFPPNSAYDASFYTGAPGDMYLNINSAANSLPSYAPGSAGFFLILHEAGHTLGLKHPHDNGGVAGRPTLAQLGYSQLDTDWFTVMSYNDDFDYNLTTWDPATPMVMDVLAMQYLYGKNLLTNAGNSTHRLIANDLYQTIWDAGGIDSIDTSQSSSGWDIQLPHLQLSSLVDTRAGWAGLRSETGLSSPHTWYWLTGDIENATGSAFGDSVQGNPLNNVLDGMGGDDSLDGGAGNDFVNGGTGKDTLGGGAGDDVLDGGPGADNVDGGDGFDVGRLDGSRSEYSVTRSGFEMHVTRNGDTDVLTSVELLQFGDGVLDVLRNARDFNNDGRDDVLLFHELGYVVVWEMGEAGRSGSRTIREGFSSSWDILPGDFNADGHADLLLKHDNGSVVLWEMRNGTILDNSSIRSDLSPDWNMTLGEFTGDDRVDVLLNHRNGAVVIWEIQAGGVANSITVREGVSPEWSIKSGDFTADGQADVLLHHENGAVVLWEMNNGHVVRSSTIRDGLSPDWNISLADLSGDGRSDVLLHHKNGALVEWTMDAGRIAASTTIREGLSADWKISSGHFSGDSEADLLLHHDNGAVVLWHMSDSQILNSVGIGSDLSASWSVI